MYRPDLVIGTGVAVISACLHIAEMCPARALSLISRRSPIEPVNDHSKTVLGDYEIEESIREALSIAQLFGPSIEIVLNWDQRRGNAATGSF